jgi:Uma2 family endonuclease
MSVGSTSLLPPDWTFAEFWTNLGGIPPERIRMVPPPGAATENDVIEAERRSGMPCELIDGTLVEKAMGYFESFLAVRIPDVCFISWARFPDRKLPREPIPALAPDLAIEVLSEGNTEAEMRRKLRDYFTAGVRLVWYIDPRTRSAKSYTSETECIEASESDSLSGRDVLPGFELSLKEVFAEVKG